MLQIPHEKMNPEHNVTSKKSNTKVEYCGKSKLHEKFDKQSHLEFEIEWRYNSKVLLLLIHPSGPMGKLRMRVSLS